MAQIELESDEAVLARGGNVPSSVYLILFAFFVLFVSIVVELTYDKLIESPFELLPWILFSGLLPTLVLAAFILSFGWGMADRWTVSDRRIFVRRGFLWLQIDQIRFDQVEDVALERGLVLRGAGRTFRVRGFTVPNDILHRVLPKWFPRAGAPIVRLGKILRPDERVIYRYPSRLVSNLIASGIGVFVILGMAALYGAMADGDLLEAVKGMFLVFVGGFGIANTCSFSSWYILITNTRLLRTFEHDSRSYDETPLSEVEALAPTSFGERLFVRVRGETIEVPAKGETAARIRDAIAEARR